jgi:site-specific DNA-methyltransferase (adenine-specific)
VNADLGVTVTSPATPRLTLESPGGPHRFFLGDCLALLPEFPAGSIDVVVTSPPYNLGIRYRTYSDDQPRDAYLRWVGSWVSEIRRVLSPAGSFFLNVGAKPSDPWVALDVAQTVRPHLRLQNVFHWVKSIAIDADSVGDRSGLRDTLAVGHYKPINSARFVNDCHEFIFHFSPEGTTPLDRLSIGVPYQDTSNIGRWRRAAGGIRCRGNTWFLPYETIQSRDRERPHPATFPLRLPEWCLRLHGLERVRRVLDPFLGLGSTSVACAQLQLPCDGIEVDEEYLDVAVERTRAALAQSGGFGDNESRSPQFNLF